jgi:hypothetical protein
MSSIENKPADKDENVPPEDDDHEFYGHCCTLFVLSKMGRQSEYCGRINNCKNLFILVSKVRFESSALTKWIGGICCGRSLLEARLH